MEKADPGGTRSSPPSPGEDVAKGDTLEVNIADLVRDHHLAVYRYAYRLSGSAADAEDLTQQVFLLAQQRLSQLRNTEKACGWLLTIVRNCYLKGRRKSNREPEPLHDEPLGEEQHELPEWIDPERLQQALSRLPEESRIIVVMFFFEDCSYKEIAEALEVPIGTVMSRLARAKAKLREELARHLSPEFTAARESQ